MAFPLDFDNLQFEKEDTYNGLRAYSKSKLANIFFMYELAERVKDSGVTVTALSPGIVFPYILYQRDCRCIFSGNQNSSCTIHLLLALLRLWED